MAPKKKTMARKPRRELVGVASNGRNHNGHGPAVTRNGHHRDSHEQITAHGHNGHSNGSAKIGAITLRTQTADALDMYFTNLNGHIPGELYNLVIREVEEPLFRAVLGYVDGNQSRAAEVLGINRGTLRKKLREYGLHDA